MKKWFTYCDTIKDEVVDIEVYFENDEHSVNNEMVLIIDDNLTTDINLKRFFNWVLSYCEGIIEGSKDKHTIFIHKEDEGYGSSYNINDVEIKWFEVTEDDKYKVTFKFIPNVISCKMFNNEEGEH